MNDRPESVQPAHLGLFFLGAPRIERDGAPLKMKTRKNIALLAYLSVTDERHTRAALATFFWPESDQAHARAALRNTLWELKHVLGEGCLAADRETVGLVPSARLWVDVAEFRHWLAACQAHGHPPGELCPACLSLLTEAVQLYRDDLLAGFTLRDSPGFDEWQFFQTECLRREMTGALEKLVRGHSAQGEFESAIAYAQRWLTLDPLDESVHCRLMRLYTWNGQSTAALRQYQVCVQTLKEELDTFPQEETTLLYQAIQENRAPSPPDPVPRPPLARPHSLPPPTTPFVGREEELTEIHRLLADPNCRLLTLVGPGGIGKTRLAVQAAMQKTAVPAHGTYFVPLASLNTVDLVAPTIADVLGFAFYDQRDPLAQLLDYLGEKEMLLVLDNLEHLLSAAELVAAILRNAPAVRILVTSRERLNLRQEKVLTVSGLRFPTEREPGGLEDYSAVQLFAQGARRVVPHFGLTEAEIPYVIRICQVLEGMPLAIELAATWVRALSCADIAAEIERSLDVLTTSLRDVPERHRSLRAAFDWSWQFLSVEERAVFRKLSVFRGGFNRAAAEQVTGASLLVLSSLVDKSLLRWNLSSGRYELHELLRQYAAEKLAEVPGEEAQVRDRHCVYYADWMQQQEPALKGAEQHQALQAIGEEIENVRRAWSWAIEHARAGQIERGLDSLFRFYEIRSWFREGRAAFARASAALRQSDQASAEVDRIGWKLLVRQGVFCNRLSQYGEAEEMLQDNLIAIRALGDPEELALCLYTLAGAVTHQGKYSRARELLEQTLAVARAARLRDWEAHSLRYLGIVSRSRGDYARAIAYSDQALPIYQEIGDRRSEGLTFNTLGNVALQQGNLGRAEAYYEQALGRFREIDDRRSESLILSNLGLLSSLKGDYARAEAYYKEHLSISQDIGDRKGEGMALNDLGWTALNLGDYARARTYLERALCIHREIGYRGGEIYALTSFSWFFRYLGDDEAARVHGQDALEIAGEMGSSSLQGDALTHLGHALVNLGQLTEAAAVYRQALTLRRGSGELHRVVEPLAGQTRILLAQGNLAQAQVQAEEILNCLQAGPLEGIHELFWIYLTCYRVLRANQDPRARDILTVAHNLLHRHAATIADDDVRRSFLENVSAHREIVSEWRTR